MQGVLIFDFDGLLVDTETVEYQSWQEIFSEYGCLLPLSEWSHCIGTILESFDPIDSLANQLGQEPDRETIRRKQREEFHKRAYAQPLRPGVEAAISQAKAYGFKLAVASSSERKWVRSHLEPRGIIEAFDCIKTSEDVEKVKPDPDLYQAVLGEFGYRPDQALVLEDSPNGIRAAKSAGIYCVAVPNSVTKHLFLGQADERLDSLTGFSLMATLKRMREYHSSKVL